MYCTISVITFLFIGCMVQFYCSLLSRFASVFMVQLQYSLTNICNLIFDVFFSFCCILMISFHLVSFLSLLNSLLIQFDCPMFSFDVVFVDIIYFVNGFFSCFLNHFVAMSCPFFFGLLDNTTNRFIDFVW